MSRSSRCGVSVLRFAPYRSRRIAASHRVPQPASLLLPAAFRSASLALLFLQPCLQTPFDRNRITNRSSQLAKAFGVTELFFVRPGALRPRQKILYENKINL